MFILTRRVDWYATWPIRVRSWPWPEVKFSTWPFNAMSYIIRRLLYRFLLRSYHGKTISAKNDNFDIFDPCRLNRWPEVKSDGLFQIGPEMGHRLLFFRAPLAHLVRELRRLEWKTIEIVKNRQHFTFDDLWWPDFWPEVKKWPKYFLNVLSRSFERRLRRRSTWPRSRVRRGA